MKPYSEACCPYMIHLTHTGAILRSMLPIHDTLNRHIQEPYLEACCPYMIHLTDTYRSHT